ncbi:TPA: hypothetical protein DCQ44_01580 [Candidatus Taylorbacteria bacterium]|nr:hypothetical protein [Candidatus Taylorbacteria bacterium]
MEKLQLNDIPVFRTPEEELAYLRGKVYESTRKAETRQDQHGAVQKTVEAYRERPVHEVLHSKMQLSDKKVEKIVLNLSPEEHDEKMAELLSLLQEKGIWNTLTVVEKLGDPHIEDDFHRFLVQYLKQGFPLDGLKDKSTLYKALHMTLFEIALPKGDKQAEEKNLKEFVGSMEQFYAGMLSISGAKNDADNYFSLEIANPNHSEESVFYASVPDTKKDLFEKQLLAIFPNAKIQEVPGDYNVFDEAGVSVVSYAESARKTIYPIKSYEEFEYDPLNIILNSFSKIQKIGEGASLQVMIKPASDRYVKLYSEGLKKLNKGVPTKEAIDLPETIGGEVWKGFKEVFKGTKKKTDEEKKELPKIDTQAIELVTKKISSPIVEVSIRIVVSGQTQFDAEKILSEIEASFNQFNNTIGNGLKFKRIKSSAVNAVLHNFSFRIFEDRESIPLNIHELASLMHFQTIGSAAPQLKQAKSGSAPAPMGMPSLGTLLGVNKHRNTETKVYMTPEDRLRHMYVIGQTGTGKSTMLKNMIIQDIQQGSGVCMIDPHGIDILDVLASVPKERYEDVIYFDPSHGARPMALNMLEYDINHPEQKTFVVNEMLSIFNKLFDMKVAGGPMFEQYFRNAVLLVMEDPETGNTLLDVSKVLANKPFREMKLSHCKNPIVVQFWREVAEKAGGEASLANIVPYITSKFDVFLSNDIMRPIISQQKSSFNFREVMDGKKILLVNLAKGRLGDINANLIGLILVGKILMSALSRVDSVGKDLPPFYLYIDEFQNVTTDSISTILSEARKYKLSLTVAHQFIAQLEEGIKDAVFGNVGSIAAFRVGSEDAEFLEKQFAPVFTAADIMNIDNHNAYVKLLVNGRPEKPFNIETLPVPPTSKEHLEALKELSFLKFGRDRAEIEADIMARFAKKVEPMVKPL